MIRALNFITLLTLIGLLGAPAAREALAQDFPYLVPQAPEFSSSGHRLNNGDSSFRPKQVLRTPEPAVRPTGDRGVPEPARAPTGVVVGRRAPKAPTFGRKSYGRVSSRPSRRRYRTQVQPDRASRGPTRQRRSVIASATRPAPAQVQSRPDCSRFPMAIANARTRPEMRLAARRYLTCLIRNGWSQDAARKHVISLIETAGRAR
jgi:hypothetical protein